ncbi:MULTISPECIES: hypothetical protein [Acinetobacter]|jgi:hypothetical protein|uniref:Uncharacterized protein n=2 Tax=Acinetobacter lwoffii TaxID=28090 RepID=A0A4Q4DYZ5_ACILW|nr:MULTISPECIES: hypothetical protein [Pseudomonadota]ODN53233.1 hypothetical protein A9Z54_11585 [Acinetobacter sp. 51m]ENU61664.1 hypothetical protein F980_02663 [Acinetobacter lwoffii NIPH 715]ENW28182.1 hypothetical protein F923_02959 [Acinetobacter lwoffii NIPH 478]ENX24750.1 hypothetical protein F893_00597 [Acinetobacter sp. CIP 102136]ENX32815.1 hypothetical protein F890_00386 [Acinetobacter sp. CIP 64.7]
MHNLQLNLPVLAFWLFLALAISAMSTAILSHNLILDGAAILVSILTGLGVVLSMALMFAEHIMDICSS